MMEHARSAEGSCGVLIVDDDKDIRESLREILEDEGFLVLTAGNGKEALDVLSHSQHPKLILVDLMMPVMNGAEFVDKKKKDPSLAGIPTVVMSASHLSPQSIADLDVNGHILKPFDFDYLLTTIRQFYH